MVPVDETARSGPSLPFCAVGLVSTSAAVFCIQQLWSQSFPHDLEVVWRALPQEAAFVTPLFWLLVVPATVAHNGWSHFVLNTVGLAFFGWQAEAKYGSILTLALAICAMVVGTGLELALSGVAKIGMSGVVFAFFGAFAVGPRSIPGVLWWVLVIGLLAWLLIGMFGTEPGVGNVAHTSGLVMGAAAGICARLGGAGQKRVEQRTGS